MYAIRCDWYYVTKLPRQSKLLRKPRLQPENVVEFDENGLLLSLKNYCLNFHLVYRHI